MKILKPTSGEKILYQFERAIFSYSWMVFLPAYVIPRIFFNLKDSDYTKYHIWLMILAFLPFLYMGVKIYGNEKMVYKIKVTEEVIHLQYGHGFFFLPKFVDVTISLKDIEKIQHNRLVSGSGLYPFSVEDRLEFYLYDRTKYDIRLVYNSKLKKIVKELNIILDEYKAKQVTL